MSGSETFDAEQAEDLAVRARRAELSAEQRALLDRALEASVTLRVAHRVGRDFDDEGRVRAGDDELILRASAGALAKPRARGRVRGLALTWMAAALLVVASAAAASHFIARRAPAARPLALGVHAASAAPTSAVRAFSRAPSSAPALSVAGNEPAAPSTEIEVAAAPRAPNLKPSHALTASERTAASLFRDASAARRAGDLGGARALYLELQASFASSNEARVSHVSLGKLLLGGGHAREAERQFRDYLDQGGGELREEALVGRAEALARFGETADERRVLSELVRTYPTSVYAARASRRLAELGTE